MRKRHRSALATLGYEVEERFIEGYPPEWQTLIKQGKKTVATIVSHGCHTDDDRKRNKYILRRKGRPEEIYKLKRQALAAWASSLR
jgi:hypothetical protein